MERTGQTVINKEQFSTGSQRDSRIGKGRYDLFPPDSTLELLAIHAETGAAKYGDSNWEKGQPLVRYLDSSKRHGVKHRRGDTDEDHLTAQIWNLIALQWTLGEIRAGRLPASLADGYFPSHTDAAKELQ